MSFGDGVRRQCAEFIALARPTGISLLVPAAHAFNGLGRFAEEELRSTSGVKS